MNIHMRGPDGLTTTDGSNVPNLANRGNMERNSSRPRDDQTATRLKVRPMGEGGMIESNRGIEQNDGMKEERLKGTEVEGGDITLEKYSLANACPLTTSL